MPFATAPITVAEGRLRVSDLEAPAQSADVGATAALGLADHQVDMRFVLTGPQRKDAPGGERPSLAVTVKGPLDNARRSADVTALVNWLTARAVEQETKRLEEAERERKRLESPERLRPDAVAAPSGPEAVTATLGRAPELPAPIEVKPTPLVRRVPPPAVPQLSPPARRCRRHCWRRRCRCPISSGRASAERASIPGRMSARDGSVQVFGSPIGQDPPEEPPITSPGSGCAGNSCRSRGFPRGRGSCNAPRREAPGS